MINYIEIAHLYEVGTSRNAIARSVYSGKDTGSSAMKTLKLIEEIKTKKVKNILCMQSE